jgi:hypothetical protein
MTQDEHVTDSNDLPPGHLEIDALVDGELVDRHALRSALNDEAARDYLVETLILRQLARDMEPTRFAIPGAPRGRLLRGTRWLAASVILVVGASVGYVYGHGSRARAVSPGLVEVVLDNRPAPPAPEPTRLIRFEPGVNWTSGTRSH